MNYPCLYTALVLYVFNSRYIIIMSIDSPCIYQCKLVMHNSLELCAACGRTRSEIVNWRDFDDKQKEVVFRMSNERLLEKLAKN